VEKVIFNFFKLSVLVSFFMILFGCSSAPIQNVKETPLASPVNLNNGSHVKKLLLSQYRQWKGTPYQYGGTSLRGVDCFAFVQNTYRAKLGYALPRTTKTQIKLGKKVSKSLLQPGDVVFFKTGENALHNGIYLGKSQFIHASSSKGVTISNLNNPYWLRTYYLSRRIR
jgi:cell wall-associated NlpC family hydrolase